VPLHPEPVGLQTPPQEPGLKKVQDGTVRPRVLPRPIDELARAAYSTRGNVGVPTHVFGRRVHHEVVAQLQWPLVVGEAKVLSVTPRPPRGPSRP
jgi:hypothetical protein